MREAAVSCAFVLTGGPGVGKTTTVRVLVRCLLALGRSVALAAPSGPGAEASAPPSVHVELGSSRGSLPEANAKHGRFSPRPLRRKLITAVDGLPVRRCLTDVCVRAPDVPAPFAAAVVEPEEAVRAGAAPPKGQVPPARQRVAGASTRARPA